MAAAAEIVSVEATQQQSPSDLLPFGVLLQLMKDLAASHRYHRNRVLQARLGMIISEPARVIKPEDVTMIEHDFRQHALVGLCFLRTIGQENIRYASNEVTAAFEDCSFTLDDACNHRPLNETAKRLGEACDRHGLDASSRRALVVGLGTRLVTAASEYAASSPDAALYQSVWSLRADNASTTLVSVFGLPEEDTHSVARFIAMCSTEATHERPIYFVR